MFRINNAIIIITALIAMFFMACEKDPIDTTELVRPVEIEPEIRVENSLINSAGKMATTGFTLECITVNYPFSFELVSGAAVIINDSTEVDFAISYQEDDIIDFVYPIEAINQNGASIIVNNIEDLIKAFIACIPTQGWNETEDVGFPAFHFESLCAELIYPFNLHTKENVIITVNDEKDFADALAHNNYYFEFPIKVVNLEGNILAVDHEEELMNILFDCEVYNDPHTNIFPFDFSFCFDITYPVSLIDEFENTIAVNNEDELYSLLFTGIVINFVYPITLIAEDGTNVEANNENTINELIDDCYYFEEYPTNYYPTEFCFSFNYPIQTLDSFGNISTANNDEEFFSNIDSLNVLNFVYPISVNIDTTVSILNNPEELYILINTKCYDNNFELFNEFLILLSVINSQCFELSYPFSIFVYDNLITINNEFEITNYDMYSIEPIINLQIKYPLTIFIEENEIIVNQFEELFSYFSNCF